jgi:UDP-N-acetylmuramate dehydrogenase
MTGPVPPAVFQRIFLGCEELLRPGEPLAQHTSYGVGGPADAFCTPPDDGAVRLLLRRAAEHGVPALILGRGTNVVVADKGFRGLVINLEAGCRGLEAEGRRVRVGAGRSLERLVRFCEERSLGGLEQLSGIPGTVGGALVMNAGAFGTEIGDRVVTVRGLTREGAAVEVPRDEAGFGYRTASGLEELVLLGCDLELEPGNTQQLKKTREEIIARRKARQPLEYPSAGSVFKRPPGDYAGRLIEVAGCKGMREGGAEVSVKHANFILNRDSASAADIHTLMERVRSRVFERFNVRLETEVLFLGFAEEA